MTGKQDREFETMRFSCLAALNDNEEGLLSLPMRKRLLAAMGRSERVPHSNRAVRTSGLVRRTLLQIASTEKVLPIWDAEVGTQGPHEMVNIARAYLDDKVSYDEAYRRQRAFGGALLNSAALPEQKYSVVFVGYAAADAVLTALMDDDLEDNGLEDEDADVYDGALYACSAYSRDLPWGELSSREKRQEFWTWWLMRAAPAAYAAVP